MNSTLLGKLIRLSLSEWGDLLAAQTALLRAQVLLWTRRRGRLMISPTESANSAASREAGRADVEPVVRKVCLAVSRAAHRGLFRPSCLVRAVALQAMLQSRGFSGSSVRVGVRRENGALLAHAWVNYRDTVLADQGWYVRKFDELARLGIDPAS